MKHLLQKDYAVATPKEDELLVRLFVVFSDGILYCWSSICNMYLTQWIIIIMQIKIKKKKI